MGREEDQVEQTVSDILNEIDVSLRDLERQSEEASDKVCSWFKVLHALLDEREETLLDEIGSICRKKEDKLQQQRNILEQSVKDGKALTRIVSNLQSPQASQCDVLRLANHLEKHVAKAKTTWEDTQCVSVQTILHVNTDKAVAEEDIPQASKQAASIHDYGIDVAQCVIQVKEQSYLGEVIEVKVKSSSHISVPSSTQEKCCVIVQCRHPGGRLQHLRAGYSGDDDGILLTTLRPEMEDTYMFRTGGGGGRDWQKCRVAQEEPERDIQLRFDAAACSDLIELDKHGKVARHFGEFGGAAVVLGNKHYTSGVHMWKLKMKSVTCWLRAGVMKYPKEDSYLNRIP